MSTSDSSYNFTFALLLILLELRQLVVSYAIPVAHADVGEECGVVILMAMVNQKGWTIAEEYTNEPNHRVRAPAPDHPHPDGCCAREGAGNPPPHGSDIGLVLFGNLLIFGVENAWPQLEEES